MEKKVAILVRAGLPFKETVLFGSHRARETGAKPVVVGVIPELGLSRRFSLSTHEMAPYRSIEQRLERDAAAFLDAALRFCSERDIAVEHRIETGGIEGVIDTLAQEDEISLIVVPTPAEKDYQAELFDAIRSLSPDIRGNRLKCPVVSVLAA